MLLLNDNYLSFNIRTLTMFGMWNPFSGDDSESSRMYNYYAFGLFFFAGMTQTTAAIINAWKSINDIVSFTHHFTIFTGMALTLNKIVNLWRHRNDIEEITHLLNYERRQPCNRKFAIYRDKIITGTIRACKLLTVTFIIMVFWYAVFTYGRLSIYHKGVIDMLPLSPLLSLRSDHWSFYWLLFVFDETTFFYIAGTVTTHDSLFMVVLIHLSAQLDLLRQRVKSCHDKSRCQEEDYIENYETLDDFKIECICRDSMQEELVKPITELHICIEHHQQILRYVHLVQSAFNHTVLLQFASSLVMITMIGFQIVSERKMRTNVLIETVTFLVCALFELFVYCWFGTDIIAKSEKISSSAYCTRWYMADNRFKQSLKILLCKGQIPIKFKVGQICELSSATFINIISKCYSAMALLQQVNE